MARFAGVLLILGALWGCQQINRTGTLPELTFDGPQVMAQAPPIAAEMASAAKPAAPQPSALAPAGPPSPADPPPPVEAASQAGDLAVPDDWVAQAAPRAWHWIVIHHTATNYGNARIIDKWHRERGFDELGYHFVIGNGADSGDGQVEVGPRWIKQKWGAHTKTADNRFNDYGIGICLVGNFDVDQPTPAQMKSLARLVAYLMASYHIPSDRVLGHGDAKPTDCPGRYMDVAQVRRLAEALLDGDPKRMAIMNRGD